MSRPEQSTKKQIPQKVAHTDKLANVVVVNKDTFSILVFIIYLLCLLLYTGANANCNIVADLFMVKYLELAARRRPSLIVNQGIVGKWKMACLAHGLVPRVYLELTFE